MTALVAIVIGSEGAPPSVLPWWHCYCGHCKNFTSIARIQGHVVLFFLILFLHFFWTGMLVNFPRYSSVQLLHQNVNYPILAGVFWSTMEYCRETKVDIKFTINSFENKELFKLQISSLPKKIKYALYILMKTYCHVHSHKLFKACFHSK